MILKNKGLMLKTFLYQIVMSFFGIMMFTATSQNQFLLILGQALVILFYYYILFSQSSQYGWKTCERDCAHCTTSSPFFGFFPAIISFLPAILLSLISFLNPPYAADGTAIFASPFIINKTFLQGMYIGIAQQLYPTTTIVAQTSASENAAALNSQTFLYLFSSIPGILLTGAGYLTGYLRFAAKKRISHHGQNATAPQQKEE